MSEAERRTSNVRVRDLEPEPAAEPKRRNGFDTTPLVGIALLTMGGVMWLVGARYTLDGLIIGSNWLLAWLTLAARIPPAVGWWVLLAIPVGLVFSRIEIAHAPMHKRSGAWMGAAPERWVIWLTLVAIDVTTTYVGFVGVEHQWPFVAQIAALPFWSVLWALVLTFAPEWLILGGWKLISKA